ncbi:polyphosphate kinase 1 [Dyadobacter frigoris]|uniref:Polyphosphate kinase n=1 Tax=Dyadobacter frigoris TaxID=2576211 RepID=A0A4U6CX84_9BACT|nr:polyphosphate kinase 1 [Dyadobacter frigoris]TKT89440.1 polyphosphate kinase 1 [Dyadobacter frigoris]GLU55412.1 polyphosphate kinase [Dyadobacter frigoris]
MSAYFFADRDISWLSFNERVLQEAGKDSVPLNERVKFLSIYSSNLDEFYRVRMPALLALKKIDKEKSGIPVYRQAVEIINRQQDEFGRIFNESVLPGLNRYCFKLIYNDRIPEKLKEATTHYFFTQIAGFLQPILIKGNTDFFLENNQLYQAVVVQYESTDEQLYLVNIPTNNISRFFRITQEDGDYIVFLEDVIRQNLQYLFPGAIISGSYNLKITRDAELDLRDEYGDLAKKIEKQLKKRDMGFATRFLYEPGMPLRHLQDMIEIFNLQKASVVEGGKHHNLKDLASLPVHNASLSYPFWPAIQSLKGKDIPGTLFAAIEKEDRIVHAPYESYDTIIRFFNEAAIDNSVEKIYTTMYRVASDSRIGYALISAAKNGKKVSVLVELKARFDEANNIRWAQKMKAAGVRIIYSSNILKVHAKIALVKRKNPKVPYLGLLATGNLNESTARFYTDHILLTAYQPMLAEMESLFNFLRKKKKANPHPFVFQHLLVAQFNLQTRFLEMIDREIENAKQGLSASITIKMNNLEEEVLISKLYDASNAGVKINLIVRSICRLVPGIPGQSENITIKRIVDRYLEHGRIFIFHNEGKEEVYMGSADWMNRNIYRRIEVCFPIYNEAIKKQMIELIALQWSDTVQAVLIDKNLENIPLAKESGQGVRSQEAIYKFLSGQI